MDKAKCDKDKHNWECKKESGFLNEITSFHSLTPTEINSLKSDTKLEGAICPKGVIVCGHCGEYLNKNKTPTSISQKFEALKFEKGRGN